jgi:hypothetical protein
MFGIIWCRELIGERTAASRFAPRARAAMIPEHRTTVSESIKQLVRGLPPPAIGIRIPGNSGDGGGC